MKKLRKYMVYLDDRIDCYKVAIPAENEAAARKYCEGNGEIIAVKDITEEYPISAACVLEALNMRDFGKIEKDLIIRTLQISGIID